MGNITAMEWAQLGPDYVRAMVLLETNGSHNSSFSFAGNRCWQLSDTEPPTPPSEKGQAEQDDSGALEILCDQPDNPGGFDVECYMYMLDKINAYMSALENREGGLGALLTRVTQPTLVVAVSKDRKDTAKERELLYEGLPSKDFVLIEKEEGIDGSLLEAEQLDAHFHSFFHSISSQSRRPTDPESNREDTHDSAVVSGALGEQINE